MIANRKSWDGTSLKPGTIVAVVTAGNSVLGSGMEPCLFAYNVPASGIIIIGPIELTMLSKQC